MTQLLARSLQFASVATSLALPLFVGDAAADTGQQIQSRQAAAQAAYASACATHKGAQMPVSDRPSPAALAGVSNDCSSEDYYYGVTGAPDFAAARACAIKNEDPASNPYRYLVLAMMYANGQGVARNLPLAINFVCREDESANGASPFAEPVAALAAAARGRSPATEVHFDMCEWGPTLFSDHCEGVRSSRDANDRQQRLKSITAKWSAATTSAFQRVVAANAKFRDAVVLGEVDTRGTGRNFQRSDKERQAESSLVTLLEALERSTLPGASEDSLAALDARLNTVYRTLLQSMAGNAADQMDGAVTATGIRDAQRAWLRYRDAWVAFAAVKYPQAPKRDVIAQLTEERLRQLEELGG